MALQNREYMRRTRLLREASWPTWLVSAGAVIAVASAAIWLLRDFQSLIPDSAPGEGSLVVNINNATQAQLETVPGIGPGLAALIIAGRPYQSADDLLRISGIGEQTLESMRPFVKTDDETALR